MIYKIPNSSLSTVKKVLEAEDMCDVKTKCSKCNHEITERINANRVKDYIGDDNELPKAKCKKCCGDLTILNKEYMVNSFKLNGFILRDGKSLKLSDKHTYLYLKAEPEFFSKNEGSILIAGVERMHGNEFERAKKEIESEQDRAATGLGGLFG